MSTLGQGTEIEFEGEVYRVAPIGPGVRSNFALWFRAWAWQQIDLTRTVVDSARFGRMEAALTMAMSLGKYEWGEEAHSDISDRRAGVAGEALARMRVNHPKLSYELVYRMGETIGWDSFVKRINVADGPLPNAEAPTTKEAEPGPDSKMTS